MTQRKHLATVKAAESAASEAPKPSVKTIVDAAENGTARDLLVAMRNRIGKTLDEPNCPARDQASLSRRLLEIRKEIEAIDAAAAQEASENATDDADEAFDASAV